MDWKKARQSVITLEILEGAGGAAAVG